MKQWLFTLWMSLSPGAWPASGAPAGTTGPAAAGHGFACDMTAMTKEQRVEHAELSGQLLAAIEERRELQNGYAFRNGPSSSGAAARSSSSTCGSAPTAARSGSASPAARARRVS